MSYSRIPCAMPNSFTPPMGPAFLDFNGVDRAMSRGGAVLRDLVESLGGLWPGFDGSVDQSGQTDRDSGGRSGVLGRLDGGRLRLRPRSRNTGSGLPDACGAVVLSDAPGSWRPVPPVLVRSRAPVVTPRVARRIETQTPVVVLPPAPVQPAVTPAPVAPPPSPARSPVCDDVTPSNVCSLIQRGCFRSGQVDIIQLAACAASGWGGNRNEFPGVVAAGGGNNGQYIGLLNPFPLTPGGYPGPGVIGVNDSSQEWMQRQTAGMGAVARESGYGAAIALGLMVIGGVIALRQKGAR